MALSLSCPCGAAFEVEDTFAGQTVSCPECQASVKVPALHRGPPRTSGLAIASLVLALVGAFTVVGTVAAVLCGLGALLSIGRSGGRLAGAGFAVFGLILGVLFTALTLFAYSRGELFGVGNRLREAMLEGQVDFSGPLEIVRPDLGYKISRPSERWGVARRDLAGEVGEENALVLVNPSQDAWVEVSSMPALGQTIDQLRQGVERAFEAGQRTQPAGNMKEELHRKSGVKVRESKRVPSEHQYEVAEMVLDARVGSQAFTYLVQVVKKPRGSHACVLKGWTQRRRFGQCEGELRKVLDSVRLLD
jgi:hypothetical protein